MSRVGFTSFQSHVSSSRSAGYGKALNLHVLCDQAYVHLNNKNLNKAKSCLIEFEGVSDSQYIKENSNLFFKAYVGLGHINLIKNNFEQAIIFYKKALLQKPKNLFILTCVGNALIKLAEKTASRSQAQEDFKKAEEYFKLASKQSRSSEIEARFNRQFNWICSFSTKYFTILEGLTYLKALQKHPYQKVSSNQYLQHQAQVVSTLNSRHASDFIMPLPPIGPLRPISLGRTRQLRCEMHSDHSETATDQNRELCHVSDEMKESKKTKGEDTDKITAQISSIDGAILPGTVSAGGKNALQIHDVTVEPKRVVDRATASESSSGSDSLPKADTIENTVSQIEELISDSQFLDLKQKSSAIKEGLRVVDKQIEQITEEKDTEQKTVLNTGSAAISLPSLDSQERFISLEQNVLTLKHHLNTLEQEQRKMQANWEHDHKILRQLMREREKEKEEKAQLKKEEEKQAKINLYIENDFVIHKGKPRYLLSQARRQIKLKLFAFAHFCLAISTGLGHLEPRPFTILGSGPLNLLTLGIVPFVLNVISKGMNLRIEKQLAASAFLNKSSLETWAEKEATEITLQYQDSIRQMTEKGVEQLAEAIISSYITIIQKYSAFADTPILVFALAYDTEKHGCLFDFLGKQVLEGSRHFKIDTWDNLGWTTHGIFTQTINIVSEDRLCAEPPSDALFVENISSTDHDNNFRWRKDKYLGRRVTNEGLSHIKLLAPKTSRFEKFDRSVVQKYLKLSLLQEDKSTEVESPTRRSNLRVFDLGSTEHEEYKRETRFRNKSYFLGGRREAPVAHPVTTVDSSSAQASLIARTDSTFRIKSTQQKNASKSTRRLSRVDEEAGEVSSPNL